MESRDNKRTIRLDIILAVSLLALALSAFLIYYFVMGGSRPLGFGARVVVKHENEVIAEYPLYIDGEYEINGGTHTITVKDGAVSVTRASCPGYQDCVGIGEISEAWQKIVCLPYRLMINLEEGWG